MSSADLQLSYNSLLSMIKGLVGQRTTIDLKDGSYVEGIVDSVDRWNIHLSDAYFTDLLENQYYHEIFFVRDRHVRNVHISEESFFYGLSRCQPELRSWYFARRYGRIHWKHKIFHQTSPGSKFFSDMCVHRNSFSLMDYDCIGFDLDNTLCEYKVEPMVEMEYSKIISYLMRIENYEKNASLMNLNEKDMDFLQRGLMLDLKRGNILKVTNRGKIMKCFHGTKEMSEPEIIECYGPALRWSLTDAFCENMISTWEPPAAHQLRTLLDYFDMPASLAFAKAVDVCEKTGAFHTSEAGVHIISALIQMFDKKNFSNDKSEYFKELKCHPEKYINKVNYTTIEWLKSIREKKFTFLLTGSYADYASFTAQYCLGDNWSDLFDLVIFNARKPEFFIHRNKFCQIDNFEVGEIPIDQLSDAKFVTQGNSEELNDFVSKKIGIAQPKFLYFGDNLVQDIFTANKYCGWDTVAVIEEMNAEGMEGFYHKSHPSKSNLLLSKKWGSYFTFGHKRSDTVWNNIIKKHSKICIPSIKSIAGNPLDSMYEAFDPNDISKISGFFPAPPKSLSEVYQ